MPKSVFKNNLDTTFTGAVLATPATGTPATEIGYGVLQLPGAIGASLPVLTGGDWFYLTCYKLVLGLEDDIEIVKVTAVDTSSGSETRITVERAQEGTTAKAYIIGDRLSLRMTAAGANNMLQKTDNLTGLTDLTAARTALGLGTAAVVNTGTGAGNAILGNDARLTDARTPTGAAGGVLSGTYPNPGFAVDMATQAEQDAAIATREPTIAAGTTSQFWRGDKSWTDFATTVRASVLTGLSTATATAATAADTVLVAFGKLQAQIAGHFGVGGSTHPDATTSVSGFMSGADKTKLNGVATGATANTGTVTSVALSLPAEFTVSGSPVSTTGTLTATKASQTQNTFFAAPNGSAGAPTFRGIAAADVPTLNQSTTGNAGTATALQTPRNINGVAFDGTGNITVADATKLAIASNLSDLNNATTARTNLGLGNVDNTSDANKPVSTAQAAADALRVAKTGDTMTGNLTVPSLNGGHLAGLRNKIINGNFDVWQRGTSFTSSGVFPYTADRWAFYRNGLAAGATLSRQTGVRWKYCLRLQRDSGNAGLDGMVVGQIIEGVNCYSLAGQPVTLRVRLRAGANFSGASATIALNTGTVEDQGNITNPSGWTGNTVAISSSISPTTSFADYTATATLSAATKEIRVAISYTPTGTAGASDFIEIEEVQLEPGSVATPFEHRPYGMELALCQRYYYRLTSASADAVLGNAAAQSTTLAVATGMFPVPMRTEPTALEQSGVSTDYVIAIGAGANLTGVPTLSTRMGESTWAVDFPSTGLTTGQGGYVRKSSTVNGFLGFSAEL